MFGDCFISILVLNLLNFVTQSLRRNTRCLIELKILELFNDCQLTGLCTLECKNEMENLWMQVYRGYFKTPCFLL
jgi:hypothetical protein